MRVKGSYHTRWVLLHQRLQHLGDGVSQLALLYRNVKLAAPNVSISLQAKQLALMCKSLSLFIARLMACSSAAIWLATSPSGTAAGLFSIARE